MSEVKALIEQSAGRLFADRCDQSLLARVEAGEWPAALWQSIEDAGLTTVVVPEALGGAGATLVDAAALMRLCGRFALPVPLVESICARWLLAQAGAAPVAGPATVAITPEPQDAPTLSRDAGGWTLRGVVTQVPWSEHSECIVLGRLAQGEWAAVRVPRATIVTRPGLSIAGEPRDELVADGRVGEHCVHALPKGRQWHDETWRLGALARCQQMVGALDWIVERTVAYAGERRQFGRAIGQFQAVQQMLADMAGQLAAARMAADAATQAMSTGGGALEVALAKARVGEAATSVAALAHQVHGAIGYSHEYALHYRTRRIWAWRDEFGGERHWQMRAGRYLASLGGQGLWAALTA